MDEVNVANCVSAAHLNIFVSFYFSFEPLGRVDGWAYRVSLSVAGVN
jgi:hypothetical protein